MPRRLLQLTNGLPEAIRRGLMDTGILTGTADGTPVQFVDVFPQTPDGQREPVPGGARA